MASRDNPKSGPAFARSPEQAKVHASLVMLADCRLRTSEKIVIFNLMQMYFASIFMMIKSINDIQNMRFVI